MLVKIKVKPGSKKEEILSKEGYLIVYLKQPAEKNKANISLINVLSKYFDVPASDIKIKHGKTGREKLIEISNC